MVGTDHEPVTRPALELARQRIRGLYLIVDPQATRGRDVVSVAGAAIRAGVRIIQYRDKVRMKGEMLPEVRRLRDLCRQAGVLFIVNDHADLALVAGADGVHVGQKDLPVADLRRILPPTMIIGCSTNNLAEACRARDDGADYVGVGSIFPTTTKVDTRPAGLETIREIRAAGLGLPLVAIGGITAENVAEVVRAGADAYAVISAVCGADDPAAAAAELIARAEAAVG